MTQFKALTLKKTQDLARLLATKALPGCPLLLWGDLGTGKSTFSRFFIRSLCENIKNIPSPTFTLVEIYDSPKGSIWHCDLYRLKNKDEALELGLEDAFFEAICLIEWPERLEDYLPNKRIDLHFSINTEDTRTITLTFHGFTDDDPFKITL